MKGDRHIFAAGLLLSVVLHAAALWAFRVPPAGRAEMAPRSRQLALVAVPVQRELPQLEQLRTARPSEPRPQPVPEPAVPPESPEPARPPAPPSTALAEEPIVSDHPGPAELVPAPAAAPTPAARRQAHGRYEQTVAQWVERQRAYPLAARQRRWEGTAIVRLLLAEDGSLLAAQLVRDTGFALLDEAALGMVRRAAPYPRLPDELGEGQIEILVPVQFSLGG